MIIFLNKKKKFTYFMLITGMKQKIFFKKNGKCSSLGLWLVNRTELSLAFVAVGRVVVT